MTAKRRSAAGNCREPEALFRHPLMTTSPSLATVAVSGEPGRIPFRPPSQATRIDRELRQSLRETRVRATRQQRQTAHAGGRIRPADLPESGEHELAHLISAGNICWDPHYQDNIENPRRHPIVSCRSNLD